MFKAKIIQYNFLLLIISSCFFIISCENEQTTTNSMQGNFLSTNSNDKKEDCLDDKTKEEINIVETQTKKDIEESSLRVDKSPDLPGLKSNYGCTIKKVP